MNSAKPVITAAIYARYSSDMQNPESANDQIARIRYHVRKGTIPLVKYPVGSVALRVPKEWVVKDEDESGRLATRLGYERIVEGIKSGAFQVLLVDDLSRLTRSLGDQIALYELLKFNEVELYSLCDGASSEAPNAKVNFFMKGFVNDIGNEGHALRTKRGQEARILKGFSAGDICYGYGSRPTQTRLCGGREIPSHYEIFVVPEQAAVINQIYDWKLQGLGLATIARTLNERKIPSSSRGFKITGRRYNWNASAVNKVLRQEKYIGRWRWGKTNIVKDPSTHKTIQKPTAQKHWTEHHEGKTLREDLIIVPLEKWTAVQEKLDAIKQMYSGPKPFTSETQSRLRFSQRLLAGLLHCGECQSNMAQITARRGGYYGCWRHYRKDRTVCSNNRLIHGDKIEGKVIDRLVMLLSNTRLLERAAVQINAMLLDQAHTSPATIQSVEKDLKAARAEIDNLLKFIMAHGDVSEAVRESLADREQEVKQLQLRLRALKAAGKPEPISAEQLRQEYRTLIEAFREEPITAKAALKQFFPYGLHCHPAGKPADEQRRNPMSNTWEVTGKLALPYGFYQSNLASPRRRGLSPLGRDRPPALNSHGKSMSYPAIKLQSQVQVCTNRRGAAQTQN